MASGSQLGSILRYVDWDPFGGEEGQDEVACGPKVDSAKPHTDCNLLPLGIPGDERAGSPQGGLAGGRVDAPLWAARLASASGGVEGFRVRHGRGSDGRVFLPAGGCIVGGVIGVEGQVMGQSSSDLASPTALMRSSRWYKRTS